MSVPGSRVVAAADGAVAPFLRPPTTGDVLRVPWATVVPLAVVFTCADQFWIVALRGAAGAISRADAPFATWLRESALLLPIYVFAVLAALTLALHWCGPHPRRVRAAATTLPLVVAAATLVAVALLIASAAYDYHLQSTELRTAIATHETCDADCLSARQQATLWLHVRAAALGGLLLLTSNLVFGSLTVAFRGGRIDVTSPRPHPGQRRPNRYDELRILLAAGLLGAAAIHNVVNADRLATWPGAKTFFGILCAAEIVVALLAVARLGRSVAMIAAVVATVPLLLWLSSRTLGVPFGPDAGVAEPVGLADSAAALLHAATLAWAIAVLRTLDRPRVPIRAQHPSRLALVGVIAVTIVGLGGGLAHLAEPAAVSRTAQHAHDRRQYRRCDWGLAHIDRRLTSGMALAGRTTYLGGFSGISRTSVGMDAGRSPLARSARWPPLLEVGWCRSQSSGLCGPE